MPTAKRKRRKSLTEVVVVPHRVGDEDDAEEDGAPDDEGHGHDEGEEGEAAEDNGLGLRLGKLGWDAGRLAVRAGAGGLTLRMVDDNDVNKHYLDDLQQPEPTSHLIKESLPY